jgi:hypothetical protein
VTGAPIPNIGPRGRRRRLRFGASAFGAAVVLGAVLFGVGSPPTWRLALFPFLWVSALGYFQARDRT